MKLRDLIRKVRQCKTASEERAVIAKESAMIRTAIREEQVHYRHRNVAKLLFMHMLGYPTHFGQLECMKLTASPHFPEKRIGYLGLLLLLSEEAEVLMLATNALKSDLTSENKFVAGLALCAIGNLATADMSRDLAPEVDKHLKSPLAYLRKKACLAMARCLLKCPDMVEDFVERVAGLLKDKSQGVLLTVVQLITQVLIIDFYNASTDAEIDDPYDTECRKAFLKLVPTLAKLLRSLLGSPTTGGAPGYGMEGDPNSPANVTNDPFLQVQLLTLLRLLGTNNAQASEEMNDVLAQVATNTDTSKNAGNAILYECVQTIMGIVSEDGLRVLAVNILGRFLLNRDNNIRYVALNTLAKCIVDQKQLQNNDAEGRFVAAPTLVDSNKEANNAMSALQRHRTTVVDCLKDPDVSIRQRALELIYHLVNQDNVQQLVGELLNYLVLCPREHRGDIATRILKVVDRYGGGSSSVSVPDQIWQVDTLITTLTIAGREATPQVQSATVVYISRAVTEVQALATHKLVKAIRDDDGTQVGLLAVGVWCIGEYGDMLLKPFSYAPNTANAMVLPSDTNGNTEITSITFMQLDPLSIVNTIETVTKRRSCPDYIKERALTAYAKLFRRFGSGSAASSLPTTSAALTKLEALLKKYSNCASLELQLRSCEYQALISASQGKKPPKITVVTTPAPESNSLEADLFGVGADLPNGSSSANDMPLSSNVIAAAQEALARMPVVDARILQKRLSSQYETNISIGDYDEEPKSARVPAAAPKSASNDLLDLFGGTPVTAPAAAVTTATTTTTVNGGSAAPLSTDLELLADIFSAVPSTAPVLEPNVAPSVDIFGAPPPAASKPAVIPADLFAAPPVVPSTDLFGGAGGLAAANMTTTSLFGAPTVPTVASIAPAVVNPLALYGASPAMAPVSATPPILFGAVPTVATPLAVVGAVGVVAAPPSSNRVPAVELNGLKVEFECSKPDTWNKQKSLLVAHFINNTGDIVYGLNLQVAVPKHVVMEMEPASSTTVPRGSGAVTQKINITNTLLGTKNLALKIKISFSSKGQKYENTTTCSGFPAGQF